MQDTENKRQPQAQPDGEPHWLCLGCGLAKSPLVPCGECGVTSVRSTPLRAAAEVDPDDRRLITVCRCGHSISRTGDGWRHFASIRDLACAAQPKLPPTGRVDVAKSG